VASIKHKWICFLVNAPFLRRSKRTVEQEMTRVFGEDFVDFSMMHPSVEDVYAFVKIKDYHKHCDRLRGSPAIKNVLASIDHPCFLSDEEVQVFLESAKPIDDQKHFKVGDAVRVVSGYLMNLTGVVARVVNKDRYSILFKFHTRQFLEILSVNELQFDFNILNIMNTTFENQQNFGINPDEHNLYRKKCRKSRESKQE